AALRAFRRPGWLTKQRRPSRAAAPATARRADPLRRRTRTSSVALAAAARLVRGARARSCAAFRACAVRGRARRGGGLPVGTGGRRFAKVPHLHVQQRYHKMKPAIWGIIYA